MPNAQTRSLWNLNIPLLIHYNRLSEHEAPGLGKRSREGIMAEIDLQAGDLHGFLLAGVIFYRSDFRKRRQPLHKD